LALGEALKTGPEFWLNLQRDWDLWHVMNSHRKAPPLKKISGRKMMAVIVRGRAIVNG